MALKMKGNLLLLPAIIYITVVTFFPEAYAVYISAFRWLFPNPPVYAGLDNYAALFSSDLFYSSLSNTVFWVASTYVVETSIALAVALLLQRDSKLNKFTRTLLIVPMMIPPVIVSELWAYLFNPVYGPVNYFLQALGAPQPNWLGHLPEAWYALIIVDIWQWTPFLILIFLAALYSVPPDLAEAAEVDGASTVSKFRYVTLPLILPIMFIGGLLRVVDLLRSFENVMLLTRGNPGQGTWLYSFFIFYQGLAGSLQVGYGAAASIVFLLISGAIVVTIIMLYFRLMARA
jgi:multiple sugar transport system permease protein